MLKRRQLLAAGWPLLSVPYWKWNDLAADVDARGEYLLHGLGAAVACMRRARYAQGRAAGGFAEGGISCRPTTRGAPMSWNDFQASVKGQGLSKEEVRVLYYQPNPYYISMYY